jgi:hypothetical protein
MYSICSVQLVVAGCQGGVRSRILASHPGTETGPPLGDPLCAGGSRQGQARGRVRRPCTWRIQVPLTLPCAHNRHGQITHGALLCALNEFTVKRPTHCEGVSDLPSLLSSGDYLLSADAEAFFWHVPIHSASLKFFSSHFVMPAYYSVNGSLHRTSLLPGGYWAWQPFSDDRTSVFQPSWCCWRGECCGGLCWRGGRLRGRLPDAVRRRPRVGGPVPAVDPFPVPGRSSLFALL